MQRVAETPGEVAFVAHVADAAVPRQAPHQVGHRLRTRLPLDRDRRRLLTGAVEAIEGVAGREPPRDARDAPAEAFGKQRFEPADGSGLRPAVLELTVRTGRTPAGSERADEGDRTGAEIDGKEIPVDAPPRSPPAGFGRRARGCDARGG